MDISLLELCSLHWWLISMWTKDYMFSLRSWALNIIFLEGNWSRLRHKLKLKTRIITVISFIFLQNSSASSILFGGTSHILQQCISIYYDLQELFSLSYHCMHYITISSYWVYVYCRLVISFALAVRRLPFSSLR